jgi:hypothetical protein
VAALIGGRKPTLLHGDASGDSTIAHATAYCRSSGPSTARPAPRQPWRHCARNWTSGNHIGDSARSRDVVSCYRELLRAHSRPSTICRPCSAAAVSARLGASRRYRLRPRRRVAPGEWAAATTPAKRDARRSTCSGNAVGDGAFRVYRACDPSPPTWASSAPRRAHRARTRVRRDSLGHFCFTTSVSPGNGAVYARAYLRGWKSTSIASSATAPRVPGGAGPAPCARGGIVSRRAQGVARRGLHVA